MMLTNSKKSELELIFGMFMVVPKAMSPMILLLVGSEIY